MDCSKFLDSNQLQSDIFINIRRQALLASRVWGVTTRRKVLSREKFHFKQTTAGPGVGCVGQLPIFSNKRE